MTPEEHELLRRSIALSEENNDILRSIQRSIRLSRFMSVLYWLVIIGVSVGAWYFIQPYLSQVESVYNKAQGQLNSVSSNVSNVAGTVNNAGNVMNSVVGGVNNLINSAKKTIGQ